MNSTLNETRTDPFMAQVVNGDGTTNLITGIVERNGMFWLENVPLNGTNQISIQATDAAGNVAVTNFTVKPSAMQFQIVFTPEGESLYQPSGMVGGTVSDSNVTVNGMNAAVASIGETANSDGSYNWIVTDAPIQGQGTATFDGKAVPAAGSGGGSGGAANNISIEMPSAVLITDHTSGRTHEDKYFTSAGVASTYKETEDTAYSGFYLMGGKVGKGTFVTTSLATSPNNYYSSEEHFAWTTSWSASHDWFTFDGQNTISGSTNWSGLAPIWWTGVM